MFGCWPGYGENLRVLEWIIDRCNNKVQAIETPIGYVPASDGIDMTGLNLQADAMKQLLNINPANWLEELKDISEFFDKFGDRLPKELWDEYAALEKRLRTAM